MKKYIVYFNGVEVGMIDATSHNDAEAKAKQKANLANEFNPFLPPITDVSVAYTEV